MVKVLLDTDIGTDVDDAVCLAYLLARPDCDLLGITTVTGEAEKRAALANVLCKFAGRDVPIYPGAEIPLRVPQQQMRAHQAEALPRWAHETRFPQGEAIEFMRRTIAAHPGELVLLAVGPLTNIGLLFAQHPEIPGLLKGFVMMGGMFNEASPEKDRVEWNTSGDPHATEIVYNARVHLHRSLGLDVTQRVVMAAEEVRARFKAPILQPVLDFAEIWFAGFYPAITFHDPLAAATLFEPEVCRYEQGTVRVDLADRPGRTLWQPGGPEAPHQVAVSVDPDRYFEHFFNTFDQGSL
jgi:inosine-uridine nucleoside N-ribohydrolase